MYETVTDLNRILGATESNLTEKQ